MTFPMAASRRVVFAPVSIAAGIVVLAVAAAASTTLHGLSWPALGVAAGFATSGSV